MKSHCAGLIQLGLSKKYKLRKEVCDERGSVKMKVDTITKFENCTLLRGDTIVKDDLWVRGGSS